MKCKYCGREVPDIKKTCPFCHSFIEGYTLNNVTGEFGYRDKDGAFHSCKDVPYNKEMKVKIDLIKLRQLSNPVLDDKDVALLFNCNENDMEMTDFERTAYRNEIDFLQHEVERYREQNKQLMEIIFKLKGRQE